MPTKGRRPFMILAVCGLLCLPGSCCESGKPARGRSSDAAGVPQSCTVFLISDGETVLGGGNEDQAAFPARAWFLPAEKGKHGRFYIGFEGVVESGMNDQGLFYDSLAAPPQTVAPEEGKPMHGGMWTLRALETCFTVEDVIAFLDGISVFGSWTDQLFFGDRNGDSIIVEGKKVIRPERGFQICTNFLQSRASPDAIPCDRYSTVERLLSEMESVSLEAVRDVFSAVAADWPGGGGTSYTTIYDPQNGTVRCYFWRDFEHPIVFDLAEELAKGPHVIDLASVAEPNPLREAWVAAARVELDGKIESRIDRTVDSGEAATDIVGQYAVDPVVGVVPIPPVMLGEVSVARDGDLVRLVVAPEGVSFDLHPAGGDLWFHVNATGAPEVDLALRRDEGGEISGATLKVIGLGEIPLVKLGNEPAYEPLPSRALPAIVEENETELPR